MKFKILCISAFALLIGSCSLGKEAEESVIIFDPKKQEVFTKLLDEEDVDYRIGDGGLIYYPAKEKEFVKEAFETVMGNKIPDLDAPE